MSAPVDISAEAVERLALRYSDLRYVAMGHGKVAATLRALRAALDAAERERDAYRSSEAEVLAENDALRFTLSNARLNDATGYARGVRDAAAILANNVCDLNRGKLIPVPERIRPMRDAVRGAYEDAILALLPATTTETKETRDAE